MKLIACVDQNRGIGFKGKLLLSIPDDMKYFKEMAMNKTIVMGRLTFESLSDRKPLTNRRNIVFSTKDNYIHSGIEVYHTLKDFFEKSSNIPTDYIFIIGGETIYNQLLPYCSNAYITKIYASYNVDKYMVNLDKNKSWLLIREGPMHEYSGIFYRFTEYEAVQSACNSY